MSIPPNPEQPHYDPQQYPAQPQQPNAPQQPTPQPGYAAQRQYPAQPAQPQYAQPQQPQYAQQAQYAQTQHAAQEPGVGEPFDGARSADDMFRPLYGATFGDATKRFFRGFVRFEGRASRSEFWWAQLTMLLILIVPITLGTIGYIGTIAEAIADAPEPPVGLIVLMFAGFGLSGLVSLVLLLPLLSLTWRRLQDANLAGPLCFLAFIPYLGGLVVLVFGFFPSTPLGRRFDRPRIA